LLIRTKVFFKEKNKIEILNNIIITVSNI
jgi:hypothetical protein